MTIPIAQLARALTADEPNYNALRRRGATILPHLQRLVAHANAGLAANAASLAGMIGGAAAIPVLAAAARSSRPQVRTAAAAGLRHVRVEAATRLIGPLLSDRSKGVRKFAVKAAAAPQHRAIRPKVAQLSRADPEPAIRALATATLRRLA